MSEQVPEGEEPKPEEVATPQIIGRSALSGPDVAEHAGSAEFVGVDGLDDSQFYLGGNPSNFRRNRRR